MQYKVVQFWLKFSMRFWISKSWSIFTDPIFKNANIFVDVMPIFESTFQQANIFFIVQSRENWVHDLFQPTYTFLAWIIDFFLSSASVYIFWTFSAFLQYFWNMNCCIHINHIIIGSDYVFWQEIQILCIIL